MVTQPHHALPSHSVQLESTQALDPIVLSLSTEDAQNVRLHNISRRTLMRVLHVQVGPCVRLEHTCQQNHLN